MPRHLFSLLAMPVCRRVVIAIVALLCVLQVTIVPAFYTFDMPIRALPFGFGPPTEAVATTGSLMVCPQPPSQGQFCTFANRMPLIPYVFAGASKLVGDSVLAIAILKTLLLDLLLLYFLSRFLAIVGADRLTLILFALVFAGPQFMLHSAAPYYEEGFLIQLLAILFIIQLAYALRRESELARWARLPAYIAVSAAIYLLKSSMILVVAWNIIFLLGFMRSRAGVRISAAIAMCLPPLLWGAVLDHVTGRFALGTSIDGLNLLEGNNPATLDFYPRYTVDMIIGDGPVELDGRTVERLKLREFDPRFVRDSWIDEWQQDDAFRNAAIAWAAGHISEELRLVAEKLWVFFFDIRNSPIVPGSNKPRALALALGMAWMASMRVVMWTAFAVAVLAARRGTTLRLAGICLFAFIASYAAPYIVGFGFERHVVPIVLPAALWLVAALRIRSHCRGTDPIVGPSARWRNINGDGGLLRNEQVH